MAESSVASSIPDSGGSSSVTPTGSPTSNRASSNGSTSPEASPSASPAGGGSVVLPPIDMSSVVASVRDVMAAQAVSERSAVAAASSGRLARPIFTSTEEMLRYEADQRLKARTLKPAEAAPPAAGLGSSVSSSALSPEQNLAAAASAGQSAIVSPPPSAESSPAVHEPRNGYRRRVLKLIDSLWPKSQLHSVLDFGAGDGEIASQINGRHAIDRLIAVDVQQRPLTLYPTAIYDGVTLPFPNRSFDLVYAVDVFHHCPSPLAAIREAARCSDRYLLVKDHTYETWRGWLALVVMDEIGNRRFGIPSRYQYMWNWTWDNVIESAGFRLTERVYPAPVHTGLLGYLTNDLQFVSLWERVA